MKKYRALILAIVSYIPSILYYLFVYNSGIYLLTGVPAAILAIVSIVFSIKDKTPGDNARNIIALILSIIRLVLCGPFFLVLYVIGKMAGAGF